MHGDSYEVEDPYWHWRENGKSNNASFNVATMTPSIQETFDLQFPT